MTARLLPVARAAAWTAGSVALLGAVAAALLLLAAAAGGVLTTPPGAWTVTARPLPGLSIRLSVPGLLWFATSPAAQRLLDGRQVATRIGVVHFARDGAALRLRCAPCTVEAPQLAAAAVVVEGAELRLERRGAQALHGELASGGLRLRFDASLPPEHVDIDWQLPPTDIAAVYAVLASVIPEVQRARIDGRVAARGRLRLPQRRVRVDLSIDGFAVAGLDTEALGSGSVTFACRAADGRTRPRRVAAGEGRWISPTQSGALLAAAVLAAEDQRFFAHPGYDGAEIARVLAGFDGEAPLRGASTITQQLARTLVTGGERTAARKLRELLYAAEMERTLPKQTILGLYLNTVDWGPGICGADAAARTYFGKRPQQLTPLEAAWLASILRQPARAYAAEFLAGAPDTARAARVLQQMRELPRRERERAARRPLVFAAPPAPTHAPQLAVAR